jgi:osmoprotectant transport system substrate-binding protein
MKLSRRALVGVMGVAALSACSSTDPIDSGASSRTGALVIGSQQYYSNEIIAECYAQLLEASGIQVSRQYQIGQREIYIDELTSGKIDLIPEYTGNLLQYFDADATVTDPGAVRDALASALPQGLRVFDPAAASDQDSYTVTRATADQYGLTSIADLAKIGGTITVAANSEFATRSYGPSGLKATYGVDATVLGVEDSGGPLTVKALTDGRVQVADIYTSDPAITANDLVVLDDPEHLILPQNVIPLATQKVDDAAASVIGRVNTQLSETDLRWLNEQSVTKQLKSADIAREWLSNKSLT